MAAEEDLKKKIAALESRMAEPNFWQNKAAAQATIEEHQRLKQEAFGGGEYDDLDAVITIFPGGFTKCMLNLPRSIILLFTWCTKIRTITAVIAISLLNCGAPIDQLIRVKAFMVY